MHADRKNMSQDERKKLALLRENKKNLVIKKENLKQRIHLLHTKISIFMKMQQV